LRRFVFTGRTYATLRFELRKIFSLDPELDWIITYVDEEEDYVTITSDEELIYSFKLLKNLCKIVRLHVQPKSSGTKEEDKKHLDKMAGRFVGHVTAADDWRTLPETKFTKTWRFRNDTKKNISWPKNCKLCFIAKKHGDQLGGPDYVLIPNEVLPNQEINISVELLAPQQYGRYTGYWRLQDPNGKKFGQRVRVQIEVVDDLTNPSFGNKDSMLFDGYKSKRDSSWRWKKDKSKWKSKHHHEEKNFRALGEQLQSMVVTEIPTPQTLPQPPPKLEH